jgi:uncharacterized protein (TIGR02118 family)
MIKLVVTYDLGKEMVKELYWEWYLKEKGKHFSTSPGLRRYAINRLLEPHRGVPPFWGMSEMYFDDMESFNRRHSVQGKGDTEEDRKQMADMSINQAGFFVDEKVIVGNSGLVKPGIIAPEFAKVMKLVFTYKLKEGEDPEEFWKWYLAVKAPHYAATPGLRRYVLNRVIQTSRGNPPFWGYTEIYYNDYETWNRSHSYPNPGETQEDMDQAHRYFVDEAGFFVEEKVMAGDQGLNDFPIPG